MRLRRVARRGEAVAMRRPSACCLSRTVEDVMGRQRLRDLRDVNTGRADGQ